MYSPFGLFDVAIDIREGEGGRKALERFQKETIRSSPDESIFAWVSGDFKTSGMLAPALDCFANSGNIRFGQGKYSGRAQYQMTKDGLESRHQWNLSDQMRGNGVAATGKRSPSASPHGYGMPGLSVRETSQSDCEG